MPAHDDSASGYIDRVRALEPLVREHAPAAERAGQLADEVVDALHDAGVFRIFLPAAMDGGDLTVPESLRLFEEVARLDGAVGWNVAIGAGGPLFGNFVSRRAFERIFGEPRVVVAGSLNPMSVSAIRVDGGYRFSGRATYVSGSAQASWLMASAILLADGSPEMVEGVPRGRSALFPMREVRILDTWSVSGMRATGSNDCVFKDVFVPDEFTYEWPDPSATWRDGPLAVIPLTTQLGGALAAVALGVARHAIEALMELAVSKVPTATRASLRERPLAQLQVARAEGLLQAARAYLFAAYEEAWRRGERRAAFDDAARAATRLASVTAAHLAAQAVDVVFDAAGATAIQTACAIERCWRDVHAITQHVILSTGRFEVIGRVLFGLDAGTPII